MSSDRGRLESILQAADDIERRLNEMDYRTFEQDRDEVALAAFRLQIIGESANKLSVEIKDRHPGLPWAAMYRFRNIVSHEYDIVVPRFVWAAAEDLSPITAMAREEVDRLDAIENND